MHEKNVSSLQQFLDKETWRKSEVPLKCQEMVSRLMDLQERGQACGVPNGRLVY